MKLTTFILMISLLQVSAASFGQKLTLKQNNVTITKLILEIRKQTGYDVLIENTDFKTTQHLNANFSNTPLRDVMNEIVKGTNLVYTIQDKTIVIKKTQVALIDAPVAVTSSRQLIDIKGSVCNDKGEPLSMATIRIKGKDSRVTTNLKGEFILRGVEENAILVISFVGFQSKEIKAKKDLGIINLIPDNSVLDEIQVIGYGTTTLRKSTGNISTITAEDIAKQPVADIFQAMEGRIPGLVIKPTSGYFSGNYSIKIRGTNNIPLDGVYAISDPLYVIDGIPLTIGSGDPLGKGVNQNGLLGPVKGQNPLLFLNPSDVESISVLKDADATAIYGARGANGVILITTKRAKPGRTNVDINIFTGYSQQSTTLKMMNTAQYLSMRHEALTNDGLIPDAGNAYDLTVWDTTRNTNWQRELLRTAKTTDGQLGFSGGDDKTSFRLNGGYHKETPPFPGDFSERRVSALLNISHTEFNKRLKTTLILNFANTNSNLPQVDPSSLIFTSPDAPSIYTADGQLNYAGWRPALFPNNLATLQRPYKANTNNFTSNMLLSYTLLEGLSINASGGYNLINQDQLNLVPGSSQDPEQLINRMATYGENNVKTWLFEPNVKWSLPLKNGNLETLLGATYQESIIDGNAITGQGFVNDSQLENRLAAASFSRAESNYNQTKIQSLYARVNYNLLDRYIFNVNLRRDGSSRFGPGKQFGNFGSLGTAWIFSAEPFVKKFIPFLSFGKLSASYGITGGDQIGDYAYLSAYKTGYFPYQNNPVLILNNAFNPDFNWTVNRKLDISLNTGFFQDRILLTSSWFRNRNGNQLVNYTLPRFTGFGSVVDNLPALVQNQGFEFQLNTKNIISKKFNWTSSGNISWTSNKLLAFPGLDSSPYADLLTIGQSVSRTALFHYTGMDTQTGYYQFEDKNKDAYVDYIIDQNFYSNDPSFAGGIENDFQYGNFSLSFFFSFTKQKGFQNAFSKTPGQLGANQPLSVLDHWQKPGDIAKYTGYTTKYRDDISLYEESDALWGDASYLRLQDMSVSYNLPSKFWGKTGPNTRFSLQGQNLFTITNYKGTDPSNPTTNIVLPTRRFLTAKIEINY